MKNILFISYLLNCILIITEEFSLAVKVNISTRYIENVNVIDEIIKRLELLQIKYNTKLDKVDLKRAEIIISQ